MTPAAIIALIKDALIIVAVGLTLYFVTSYGKDVVKVDDMQAVQKQLTANTQQEALWRQEQADAQAKRAIDLSTVAAAIGGQRAPVYVLRSGPADPQPVPGHPAPASSHPAGAGGADAGSRGDPQPVDVRPQANAYELKYETALADCRSALDQWPIPHL